MGKATVFNFDTLAEEQLITIGVDAETAAQNVRAEVQRMLAAGMEETQIIDRLDDDWRTEGRIFGGLRTRMREAVGLGLDDVAQGEVIDEYLGTETWQWVTTSADPCPDCKPRHNETASYEQWRARGLPRSGFSVCEKRCRCVLIPEDKATDELSEPVIVPTLTELRKEYQGRQAATPRPGTFAPLATVAQAETWARDNILWATSTPEIAVNKFNTFQANAVLAEMAHIQAKYGRIPRLKGIKTVTSSKFAARMNGNTGILEIDNRQTDATWRRRVQSGIEPSLKPGLAGLVDHELGHAFTPAIFEARGKMTAFGKSVDAFHKANKSKIENTLGAYAASARHEFVADAFAMREKGTAPKWVTDWLSGEGI